jgi:flagellar biosynthesis chaperone FliJ
MKVLSEKESICTSIKVLYDSAEEYDKDLKEKKKDGWNRARKPNFYYDSMDVVEKYTPNGIIVTYLKYKPIK